MCKEEITTNEHLPDEVKHNEYNITQHNILYSEYNLLVNSLKNNKLSILEIHHQ